MVADCMVKDISGHGAQLRISEDRQFPSQFQLKAEGLPQKTCVVRWTSKGGLGVEFVSPSLA